MGMDLFVYTQTPIEDSSVFAQIRKWKKEGDGWVCRTRTWQVVVSRSKDLNTADVGPELSELMRIRPETRYRTEINIEGRQSNNAFLIALASAHLAAFRMRGVIYDPQQDVLIVPLSEGWLASMSQAGLGATRC